MSALAPIALLDGKATPVSHTFSPVKVDAAGVAKLVDRASGISIGFPQLSLSVREPSKSSRNYRVMAKIVVPTLEVTSPNTATGIQPAPTKAYDCFATIEFVLPERSVLSERTDLLAYCAHLLANASFRNSVLTYEGIY